MKKFALLMLLLVLVLPVGSVFAQEEAPYNLSLRRDWGYGSGADIQGQMTLSLRGEESQVAKVTFLMDGEVMAEVSTAPFKFSFSTDHYPSGTHQLSADVETKEGKIVTTRKLTYRFLTGNQATAGIKTILIPIGIITLLSLGAPALIQTLGAKKRKQNPGQPVDYGVSGGAICPKCGHPFPRSWYSPHIGMLKVERCPSCKKFSLVGRASLQDLRDAEMVEARQYGKPLEELDSVKAQNEQTDNLDDTRYSDGI